MGVPLTPSFARPKDERWISRRRKKLRYNNRDGVYYITIFSVKHSKKTGRTGKNHDPYALVLSRTSSVKLPNELVKGTMSVGMPCWVASM